MSAEDLKTCSKCKEEKPRSEFNKSKANLDGLKYRCRECGKQYYKDNPEKIKQQRKRYYKDNAEKIKQHKKQYYKDNPEKFKQYKKQYYKDNAEKIKQQRKRYYKDNAEKCKQQRRQHYKDNAEKEKQQGKQRYKDNIEKVKQRQKQYRNNLPAGVYSIKNTITGQTYIGQSTEHKRRWNDHKSRLRLNKHPNYKMQEDCSKYGLDVFEFEIIKEFPCDTTPDVLLEEETRTIAEYIMRGESLY